MAKNDNLTDFLTDIADAIREQTGGGASEKINPQEFADRIRSLPVLGEECDCLIYFNDTQPANKYGGTWEELPQGTFLRAVGSGGAISSGTATDGGSNTHTHLLGVPDDTDAHALIQWNSYKPDGEGFGMLESSYEHGGWVPTLFTPNPGYGIMQDKTGRISAIQVVGYTKSADNEPIYKNIHIWRKIS